MGKRNYGTGHIYIKWGSYYGRWRTLDRRLVNRKLGKVRPVGQRSGGLTRVQAEREMARKREEEDRAPRRELRSQPSMRSPTPAPKRSPIFAHAKRRKFISNNPVSEATRPGR